MTEYIEKNKAIKELYEVYDYEFPTASGGFDEYARMIVPNTIKNMPAADVAPVRHGRWLTWEEQFPGSTPKKQSGLGVFCDKCHGHADNRTDYCPNCGAKMDGSSNEE